ncbi:hypothetical protein GCM10020369_41260 [Cryptosporangium minutisporangium]|uniref:Uncharacterized protein n=1 Tax=Cryptosporangium minutisporangium TaxID=113569 RepID=A0ABP6T056_9ACTN
MGPHQIAEVFHRGRRAARLGTDLSSELNLEFRLRNQVKTSRADLLLGNVTTASYVEGAIMSSFLSIIVAAVIGVVLAVATTIGIVSISKQSPENTPAVSKPLVQYGHR